ncbi:ABC transporter permease [Hylemonella gracilis]|jgi:putative ABC transport system permease protein|uniref:ABC transporter permease n=1 Tax=Hylemonella gracilis TaxID=80880 RepID=A0A4P6UIN8_9BURK|nr:FtsX-like permease family protein [Hylemonella gracilis]QBK03950.1 ABC transporter permease [Hylemonella gracilis]
MNLFDLAWRNLLRNRRRSLLTLGALAVSAMALVIFGGYVATLISALQTETVRETGHLQIMRKGFLDFGRGNTARYAIRDHAQWIARIRADAELQPLLRVVTPVLQVQGVAGNFASGASSTFSGMGWLPADRDELLAWAGAGLPLPPRANLLRADQPQGGVIGLGLAQLLALCEALELRDCVNPPKDAASDAPAMADDLSALARQAGTAEAASASGPGQSTADTQPGIELLSSTSGGAPSVLRMDILRTERQGVRELDVSFVAMPLGLAERLVFGPGGQGASAIVVQLAETAQLPVARARLRALLDAHPGGADLEVRDFTEVQPQYLQVVGMFQALFRFVALLMGVVTLFSVANAVGMSVGERVGEIGTLRSLGFRRGHVRRMFILEGVLIGLLGALLGVVAGVLLSEYVINQAGWSWTPPGRVVPVPVGVDVFGHPALLAGTVLVLAGLAALSSLLPANRAARMQIVEALRHV